MHLVTFPRVKFSDFPPFKPDLDLFSFSFSFRSSKAELGLFLMGDIIDRKLLPLRVFPTGAGLASLLTDLLVPFCSSN